MSISIRLAIPSDAPDMADVHMRSWEIAYKDIIPLDFIIEKNSTRHALYKRVITDENANSYVIQYNGKTVGIMRIASPQDDDIKDEFYEIHYLYLHSDYFRMGIGFKSINFAFDKTRSLGKKGMSVWVIAENVNSIKFYEKCGFIKDGNIKYVEYGKVMDCIRMRRYL